MDILTIKEASLIWNISERRISFLCNEGRIEGAKKVAGVWLLPKDAEKPKDERIKSGEYINWRNKSEMKLDDFDNNLKNLRATFAVENMQISENVLNNIKRIESGRADYTEVVEELKQKYMQRG